MKRFPETREDIIEGVITEGAELTVEPAAEKCVKIVEELESEGLVSVFHNVDGTMTVVAATPATV